MDQDVYKKAELDRVLLILAVQQSIYAIGPRGDFDYETAAAL